MSASTTLRAAAVLSVLALTLGTVPAGGCAGPAPSRDPRARRRPPVADERWARTVAGGPSGIAADRAGAVTVSGRGRVTSFDAAAGTRLWEADVGGPPTPFVDPAVDHALVLVAASEGVVALDRATGAVRWQVQLDAGSSGDAVRVATAVVLAHHGGGPLALVGTDRGVLSARETASGAERWRSAATGALDARPAVDGEAGLVVASWSGGARTTLRALDLRTGAPRWERSVDAFAGAPVIARGVVVVGSGDGHRASVRAFSLADGRDRWSRSGPAAFEPGLVAAVDRRAGTVVVADRLGSVAAFALADGRRRWRHDTEAPSIGGTVVVAGDIVAVRNEGDALVLLDRRTGRPRAQVRRPAGPPRAIAGSGARVFVAWRAPGASGAVGALAVPSGQPPGG